MASVEENRTQWSNYDWSQNGDEWSAIWGGTKYQWYATIFPRILNFLPAGSILEIAPGMGRCTQFLLENCKNLTVVDLTERCIEFCKQRFSHHENIDYFVNDGYHLDMIQDNSIDFVFSWDSLVHVESDVIHSYLEQLSRKLKTGGIGFIHHSNFASFKKLDGSFSIENKHWRGASVDAALFKNLCEKFSMQCISQELINWGCDYLTDSLSLFIKTNRVSYEPNIVENANFMEEARRIKKISELYHAAPRFTSVTPRR